MSFRKLGFRVSTPLPHEVIDTSKEKPYTVPSVLEWSVEVFSDFGQVESKRKGELRMAPDMIKGGEPPKKKGKKKSAAKKAAPKKAAKKSASKKK
jgi:hypothetical protein